MPPAKTSSAKNPEASYANALKLLFQRKYEQAEKALRKVAVDFPEEMAIQARVRSYLRLCEQRMEAAKSKPDSVDAYDKGVVEHNRGNFAEAVKSFKEALKKTKSQNDHIHYALAASEARLGHGDKAREHLQKAIEANPNCRFFAQNDSDFRSVQGDESFRALVRPSGKR